MTSHRSILTDLFLFRQKADVLYNDAYKVSRLALQIISEIEPELKKRGTDKDIELLVRMHRLIDLTIEAATHSSEYATSLVNEYKRVMEGINKL
ncbi:hypothetical protein M2263_004644 [Providencia alcalifaciens]|nr:hypothetical protein [Providencia alcalifaciens]